MSSDVRTNIRFNNANDAGMIDDLIRNETLATISDIYYQNHPEYGTIRYFFSCFRNSVDYSGNLLVNAFFSEANTIGLSVFTSLRKILSEPSFQTEYKENLHKYIDYLNDSVKTLTGINYNVFNNANIDDIVNAYIDTAGEKILG